MELTSLSKLQLLERKLNNWEAVYIKMYIDFFRIDQLYNNIVIDSAPPLEKTTLDKINSFTLDIVKNLQKAAEDIIVEDIQGILTKNIQNLIEGNPDTEWLETFEEFVSKRSEELILEGDRNDVMITAALQTKGKSNLWLETLYRYSQNLEITQKKVLSLREEIIPSYSLIKEAGEDTLNTDSTSVFKKYISKQKRSFNDWEKIFKEGSNILEQEIITLRNEVENEKDKLKRAEVKSTPQISVNDLSATTIGYPTQEISRSL